MISGEMDPKSPAWLTQQYEILRGLWYAPTTDSETAGDNYALQTETVGLEYLKLSLTEPDQAVDSIGGYLRCFGDINRSAGVLSPLTTDQFGMIVNMASLHYTTFDRDRLLALHGQIDKYFSNRNSASIPGLTAQLRKPELVRDLVAHWSALHWPRQGSYAGFLVENVNWEAVQNHIELPENNPVLFALTVPLDTTHPMTRQRFRGVFPELAQHGVDIIAAHLYNKGGHDELLRESANPQLADWYKAHYKGWEDSIYDGLEDYGREYHPDILRAITEAKWNIFTEDENLYLPSLTDKMIHTSFRLNEDRKLVRNR